MFIKLEQNMHQRMRLNLLSSKPSGSSCSRYSFSGSGSRYCSSHTCSRYYSSMGSSSVTPSSTTRTNKHTIRKKKINVLPLSSNQEKFRYGDRSNIFGWFSNGMAEIMLEMAWSNFRSIGECLAHEMMG